METDRHTIDVRLDALCRSIDRKLRLKTVLLTLIILVLLVPKLLQSC
tara:strand:- start:21 stop:161 length:141 start_codon:yes stop_codon:yes gene_type:complete